MTTDWSEFRKRLSKNLSQVKDWLTKAGPQAESQQTRQSTPAPPTKVADQILDRRTNEAAAVRDDPMKQAEAKTKRTADPGRQRMGQIYAKALLAATDENRADEVLGELGSLIDDVFPRIPAFEQALASPRMAVAEKLELLDKTLKSCVSPELLRFLKVVCEHGRMDCLHEIRREAIRQRHEYQGVIDIEMVTAEPAEPSVVRSVEQTLSEKLGRPVQLQTRTDPDLIGGVQIRVGDRVHDASIAQKLKSMRAEAITHTVRKMREASERFAAT